MSNHEKTKKVIIPRQSVHVVFFSCSDCGEEDEHIHFCKDCGKPMRVINVVEKFGEEAERFIREENGEKVDVNTMDNIDGDEQPNIIILANEEERLNDGALIIEDEVDSLDEIYPDDDEEKIGSLTKENFNDLEDIIAELDKEEDDDFSLADDLGEEGLPEL